MRKKKKKKKIELEKYKRFWPKQLKLSISTMLKAVREIGLTGSTMRSVVYMVHWVPGIQVEVQLCR